MSQIDYNPSFSSTTDGTRYAIVTSEGKLLTSSTPTDYWLQHVINTIASTYGDIIDVSETPLNLLTFGRNATCQTTKTTLMGLPTGVHNETYPTGNTITSVSSSSVSDTQLMVVEGHTIDINGSFISVSQTLTLNGRTTVSLTTPLARVQRIYNNGSTDLVGTIYVYETDSTTAGVPNTGTKVHCMITAGLNISEKSSATVSHDSYWVITNIFGDCLETANSYGIIHLETRLKGKTFLNLVDVSCNDSQNANIAFQPYIIIPKNGDVRLRIISATNNKDFSGGINGILLKIVE